MAQKRKAVHLKIEAKYNAILMKEAGVDEKVILEKYGISDSTFKRMLKKKEDIKKEFLSSTITDKKAMESIEQVYLVDIDKIVFHWYVRCKERNVPIKESDVKNKAAEISKIIKAPPCFPVGSAWLHRFKHRYRLPNARIMKDVPETVEIAATVNFHRQFKRLLEDSGCVLEKNIYNVVYEVMMWKSVPSNSSILKSAKSTGNQKICEDYVTALFCANVTGCHKLPILIIGTEPETQRLYNLNTEVFSTIYKSNTNACMNSTIFTWWYKEHFLESIKARQERESEVREITILLLDNASLYHDLRALNEIDPFVIVTSPPDNVSRSRQPLNNGVISCFKRKYRKELAQTLSRLPTCRTQDELIDFHKALGMWDCCRLVHDAWSHVDDETIIKSWNLLLQRQSDVSLESLEGWNNDITQTLQYLHDTPGCEKCNEDNVADWFATPLESDIVSKVITDEVLEEYQSKLLDQPPTTDIFDDEAGPSSSKLAKRS